MTHNVNVTLAPGGGHITVNGHTLDSVRYMHLYYRNGQPVFMVELLVERVEVDGEILTVIPRPVAADLEALGWTPPPVEAPQPKPQESADETVPTYTETRMVGRQLPHRDGSPLRMYQCSVCREAVAERARPRHTRMHEENNRG